MSTVGKLQIGDAFTYRANKEQGVIAGEVLEGTVNIGNFVSFTTQTGEKNLRILAIEKVQTISGHSPSLTGLLIALNDQSDLVELKLLRNTEVKIIHLPS